MAAAIAAFSFASCQKEAMVDTTVAEQVQNTKVSKVNISVGGFGEASTKAMKKNWEAGDKINIWFDANVSYRPDLVILYDGEVWDIDESVSESLSGRTPSASGTLKAVYESSNDYFNTFGVYGGNGQIVPKKHSAVNGREAFAMPMLVYTENITYSFEDGELDAFLNGWSFMTPVQVVIKGLEGEPEDYAIQCDQLYAVSGFYFSNSKRISIYGEGTYAYAYYQKGVANKDGVAFYFYRSRGDNTTLDVKLMDIKENVIKSYRTAKTQIVSDSKKCQGIILDASKFTARYFMVDGIVYKLGDNGKVEVIRADYLADKNYSYSGDIVIPSTITYEGKQHNVIGLMGSSFSGAKELKSVVISEGVTYAEARVFESCPKLESVYLPKSFQKFDTGNVNFSESPLLRFSVASDSPYFMVEDEILYSMISEDSYHVVHVPENKTGDIVFNAKTTKCENGAMRNTAADSFEFPECFEGGTWNCFYTCKNGLELRYNNSDFSWFSGSVANSGNFSSNFSKIILSLPANTSDEDWAKWYELKSTMYFKDVIKRAE